MRPCIQFVQEHFDETPIVGAEIGVFRGENSEEILEKLPNVQLLYLIDPYEPYTDWKDRLKPGIIDAKQIARTRLLPFKDRVKWIQEKTENCIEYIKHDLDFIYIDGNHAYKFIKNDIEVAMKLVKSQGIIGGHDYRRGVKLAVDEFCENNGLKLYLKLERKKHSDWWFIKP